MSNILFALYNRDCGTYSFYHAQSVGMNKKRFYLLYLDMKIILSATKNGTGAYGWMTKYQRSTKHQSIGW